MLKSHTKRIKNIQKVALGRCFIKSGQKYENPKFSQILYKSEISAGSRNYNWQMKRVILNFLKPQYYLNFRRNMK